MKNNINRIILLLVYLYVAENIAAVDPGQNLEEDDYDKELTECSSKLPLIEQYYELFMKENKLRNIAIQLKKDKLVLETKLKNMTACNAATQQLLALLAAQQASEAKILAAIQVTEGKLLAKVEGITTTQSQVVTPNGCKGPNNLKLGHNYYFSSHPLSWPDAVQFCKTNEMALVSIESAQEQQALEHHLTVAYGTEHKVVYWTSGTDVNKQGNYRWEGSSQPIIYNNFGPNGNYSKHDCLALYAPSYKFRWVFNPCNLGFRFICEDR